MITIFIKLCLFFVSITISDVDFLLRMLAFEYVHYRQIMPGISPSLDDIIDYPMKQQIVSSHKIPLRTIKQTSL